MTKYYSLRQLEKKFPMVADMIRYRSDIKPEDVAPVVRAYWIEGTNPCEWSCSNCGDAWHGDPDLDPFDDHFYYCPSCGAKMSLKDDTQETHKDD